MTGSNETPSHFPTDILQKIKSGQLTSGQHEPIFPFLQPYGTFPKEIKGPTVWHAKDFSDNPENWIHWWTQDEINEIADAIGEYKRNGWNLIDISKQNFILPTVAKLLEDIKKDLLAGKGFVLFKGLPVYKWTIEECAIAYMGIGTYFGNFVSQNGKGHVLGHVKDLGVSTADKIDISTTRIYTTTARQFFHVDDSDIVGLLCLHKAMEGGESDVVSSHHVYNCLQRERPDVIELMANSEWYWDRKGEVSTGQRGWFRQPILSNYKGKIYTKIDPYFVRSLKRFAEAGEVPPLSERQEEALQVFENICLRESLHMILDVGDIQLLSNTHVLHARTAYTDDPKGDRRHLMRLWLSVPEKEGGWDLPYWDNNIPKRGGIQVDGVEEKVPLDAE